MDKYAGINKRIILDGWNEYILLHEGDWVQTGPSFDEGVNNPTVEGLRDSWVLLQRLYDLLLPYEQEIEKDFETLPPWSDDYFVKCAHSVIDEYRAQSYLRGVDNSSDNSPWVLSAEDMAQPQFSPSSQMPLRRHYDFLRAQRVIDAEMSCDTFFVPCVKRGLFGRLYVYAERARKKTHLRAYVHRLGLGYFGQDYLETAARSMGLSREQLGRHDGVRQFERELESFL